METSARNQLAGTVVSVSLGAVMAEVTIDVKSGETVVLLGTNGNGKSTLMKCIMGIVRPVAGRITAEIDGIMRAFRVTVGPAGVVFGCCASCSRSPTRATPSSATAASAGKSSR